MHELFLKNIIQKLMDNEQVQILAITGSGYELKFDQFADLDLVIGYENTINKQEVLALMGDLIGCFTGYHVGEPRLEICLFKVSGDLLQVDAKFVELTDFKNQRDKIKLLFDKTKQVDQKIINQKTCEVQTIDWNFVNQKFYKWIHFGIVKLARGEIHEAISCLNMIWSEIIANYYYIERGILPRGMRRIEQIQPELAVKLSEIMPSYELEAVYDSYLKTLELYEEYCLKSNVDTRLQAEVVSFVQRYYAFIIQKQWYIKKASHMACFSYFQSFLDNCLS
ncbi:MAG: hypothetical protein ACRCUP_02960 [Mycoplasmatales bacterium]